MHPDITESHEVCSLVLNVPGWFDKPDFVRWLNDTRCPLMTLHTRGTLPTEWSDTMVFVDGSLNGEGSGSDMPDWAWTAILEVCREKDLRQNAHIPVRLINV